MSGALTLHPHSSPKMIPSQQVALKDVSPCRRIDCVDSPLYKQGVAQSNDEQSLAWNGGKLHLELLMIGDVPEVILFEREERSDIVSVAVEGRIVLRAKQVKTS